MTSSEHAVAGTLALLGGDEWSAVTRELDAELLAASGGTTVVVLPTAKAFEHPERVGPRAEAYFSDFGAEVEVVPVLHRAEAEDRQVAARLEDARFVYLPDGSSLHLRSVLKGSVLEEALLEAYRGGAVIAASGEAAMVLCDPMIDRRGGAYTLGLGVVEGVAVDPHYDHLTAELRQRPLDLLPRSTVLAGIDDETALVRRPGGIWRVSGTGMVTVYDLADGVGRQYRAGDEVPGLP